MTEAKVAIIFIIAQIILITLIVNYSEEPAPDNQEYCSMWEIWHNDRRAGVPVDQRYGWPDSEGRYYIECNKGK